MSRVRGPLWIVILAMAAVVVETGNAVGRWHWHSLARELGADSQAGAERIATSLVLVLPPATYWSRRLSGSQLVGARSDVVVSALSRLGRLQARFFPTDPSGFKNTARAAIVSGDLAFAAEELEQALVRDPSSPYLNRLMAVLLREAGQPQRFLDSMATAEAIAPGYNRPQVDLTPEDRLWIRRASLERRLQLYPRQRVRGLLALAGELRGQGEEERAEAVLTEVATHPDVQLQFASWELEAGQPGAAAARAATVARRRSLPARVRGRAWSMVATARDLDGDVDGAVEAANQALRLGPSSPAPYLTLATLAERRGNDQLALEHLRRAWGIAPSDLAVLLRFAKVAERAGYTADARLVLERAVELAPERADVAARQVEFLLRQKDYMEATTGLAQHLERFPTDPTLLRLVGQLRQEVSRFEER